MKAAILTALNAPLMVDDVEIPQLSAGQVLVKVCATGICGKQINEISGACGPDNHLPHLLGHEGAGVVELVGEGVTTVQVGDRVVLHWRKGPGLEGAFPKYRWGDTVVGGGAVTTFNEQAIIFENRLTRIENDVPFDVAALMGCAVTTGLGVVFKDADLDPGQKIGVIGCGGVGLNVIQGARIAEAGGIWAIDKSLPKMRMALDFGATNVGQFPPGVLDFIVDTTGRPEMIAKAYDIVAPGGTVIMVGQPRRGEDLVLPDASRNFQGKHLMDSTGGNTQPHADIPWYLTLWRSGTLKLSELITHRFALEEINLALEVTRSGDCGRVIVEMA